MPFITTLFNIFNNNRLKQIDYFKVHPIETQEKVLAHLLRTASNTEQGSRYGYKSITNHKQFANAVPLQSYDNMVSIIERLRDGERDILWPGQVQWFAKSSGTTSTKSKFIPVTKEALNSCHYRGVKDLLAIFSRNNPGNRLFYGKALTLGGSHKINPEGNHALAGDLSAILLENAPQLSNFWKSPDKQTALISDFGEKLDKLTRISVNQNITSMSGVPSWYLTLIKYILNYTGKNDLSEVWPNLEVFFHGGISFSPYRDIYKQLISSEKMKYMETYNASEGFFGIQDDPSDSNMLLMLDYGVYYEFIPVGSSNQAIPLEGVETGVNYSMIISTDSGLWRYAIGDTITFSSIKPYKFHITGRTKQYINAFGEEVIVDNADRALKTACEATMATVIDYTAGPVFMSEKSRGGHEWIIEFEQTPNNIDKFTEILDNTLKDVNSDYEAKRYNDINLVMPIVKIVPRGTFEKWMKSRGKIGGQNKVPRLANDRSYLDMLNSIL